MTAKIFSIISQKGGTGKTITALSLAEYLARQQKKVLLIDFDIQGNASYTALAGVRPKLTVNDIFNPDLKISDCVISNGYYDILASSDIQTENFSFQMLKEKLHAAKYHYIIIDNAPTLSDVTIATMLLADRVIIPLIADSFALQGLNRLMQNILSLQQQGYATDLKCKAFINRYTQTSLSQEMLKMIAEYCEKSNIDLIPQYVRQSIAITEAAALCEPILAYKPKNKAIQDLIQVIEFLVK